MADKQALLNEIYDTSFAVTELTLYLDTHPDDAEALSAFYKVKTRRQMALSSFEREHYPLTADCVSGEKSGWTWGSAPPPWKGGHTNVEL